MVQSGGSFEQVDFPPRSGSGFRSGIRGAAPRCRAKSRLERPWLGSHASLLAGAADVPPFDPSLPAKSRCVVAIEAVGRRSLRSVTAKSRSEAENIVGKSPKKLKKYMEEHLPLLVVGPGGVPYLIDGHHLALALLNHRVADHFEARIEANWRDLSPAEFWKNMQNHGWVYLYDNKGQRPLAARSLAAESHRFDRRSLPGLGVGGTEAGWIPEDQCLVRRIPMGRTTSAAGSRSGRRPAISIAPSRRPSRSVIRPQPKICRATIRS